MYILYTWSRYKYGGCTVIYFALGILEFTVQFLYFLTSLSRYSTGEITNDMQSSI